MATIKLLLGIICLGFIGSIRMSERNLLNAASPETAQRVKLLQIAMNEVGVREKTGNNDGSRVEAYLATVGLKRGQPWCAAYVSWVYAQAGFGKPRSGWSPDLFPAARLARSALPGNILGIYFPELKRIAHVGLIVSIRDDWVTSCEGNTNVAGNREGDGVYVRIRHMKTIYRVADWVSERRVQQ
jgi:hypothetical protein